MNIKKGLIITLDDQNEYYVISTALYNNEKYAYLMNINKEDDYIFIKEIKNGDEIHLQIIKDETLIKRIALYLEKDVIEG